MPNNTPTIKYKLTINDVLRKRPDLTYNGVNSEIWIKNHYHGISADGIKEKLSDFREAMFSYEEEFWSCVQYLQTNALHDSDSRHSYRLKHIIEKDMGIYLPNGILIAAAIYLDLPIKNLETDCPNVIIGEGCYV